MKLIIGLGNPGVRYKKSWHNFGFLVLDQWQKNKNFPNFKIRPKLQAAIAVKDFQGEKIILAKPITFMNHSGIAAAALLKYYRLTIDDLIVIHDEIDLPLGRIKISRDASAAGHRGVASIIQAVGNQNFTRIRLGVKNKKIKPKQAASHVLMTINASEINQTQSVIKETASAMEKIIIDGPAAAMNIFNLKKKNTKTDN